MKPLALGLCLILMGCASQPHADTAGAARDVAQRIFVAFNDCDIDRLVSNYGESGIEFFTPGTARALTTRAELRNYFGYLKDGPCASPDMPKHLRVQVAARSLGADAALAHVRTQVSFRQDGKDVRFPFRFTLVMQRQGAVWQVISQDAQAMKAE